MCLRFVFLLIMRLTSWLRLSQREETWKIAKILILRYQLAVDGGAAGSPGMRMTTCDLVSQQSAPASPVTGLRCAAETATPTCRPRPVSRPKADPHRLPDQ
jgi:hypothetical protein